MVHPSFSSVLRKCVCSSGCSEALGWLKDFEEGRLDASSLLVPYAQGGGALGQSWFFFFRALAQMDAPDLSGAAEDAKASLQLDPQGLGPLAHYLLGLMARRDRTIAGNAQARDHFAVAAKAFSNWAHVLGLLGEYAYYTDSLDIAIPALAHAVELSPHEGQMDYFYVQALVAAGDDETLRSFAARRSSFHPLVQDDVRTIQQETPAVAKRVRIARYPTQQALKDDFLGTVRDTFLADLDPAVPFIAKDTRFFTMGSCFAGNVARALVGQGYACRHLLLGETVNTTFANRRVIAWLLGAHEDDDQKMRAFLGDGDIEAARESLKTADVLIYTLGVAPCFFDQETGAFVLPKPTDLNVRTLASHYTYRTTTVAENEDNLRAILDMVRGVNPSIRIFISVSPVPLRATFERKACVSADCLSKSVLRVVAENVTAGKADEGLFYWPAFEIVRWLSGHVGPFYGTDDGASVHVSEAVVAQAVGLFLEMYRQN